MGSEDLFHGRRSRSKRDLKRNKSKRDPYERVLIVCEGQKTEPNYFRELINAKRLNSANVEVDGECGSSPLSVWKHAKKLYESEMDKGDAYDKVYCLFDKDSHSTFVQTIDLIRRARPKNTFYAISSIPCFEYWLLLHFDCIGHPFAASRGKSPCECLTKELKKYLKNYQKGNKGLYKQIANQTTFAINNSKAVLKDAAKTGANDPSTYVHELVEYLCELKK